LIFIAELWKKSVIGPVAMFFGEILL